MIKLFLLKKMVSSNDIKKWISWLNNKSITEFSDKRFNKHTILSQKKFLKKKLKKKRAIYFKLNLIINLLE